MSLRVENIVKKFTQVMQESNKPKTSAYNTPATITRIEGNKAYVHIDGGVDETEVALTIGAKVGDTVQVHVGGGDAFIVGNETAPPTDDTYAKEVNINLTKGITVVRNVVNAVKTLAERTAKIAGNTNQYFWHIESGTDTGAHITEIPQEEFLADPENGGGNFLARTNGLAIRDGLTELATFSGYGSTIGKIANNRLRIESDRMNLLNAIGTATFSVEQDATSNSQKSVDVESYNDENDVIETTYSISDTNTQSATPYAELTVNGNTYTLNEVSCTATTGVGVSVVVNSSAVTEILGYMEYIDENSGNTMYYSAELTVSYMASVSITALMNLTGSENISGEGNILTVINNKWSSNNQKNTYVQMYNQVSGKYICVGVGAGGQNRGIWDGYKWIICSDSNNRVIISDLANNISVMAYPIITYAISSGGYSSGTINIKKSGWYPVGIVGWTSNTRWGVLTRAAITNRATGSGVINWMITNPSSSSNTPTVTVHVLWVRA